MAFIKWFFIVAGGILVLSIGSCAGIGIYYGSAEAVGLTLGDLKASDYVPGERATFMKSCQTGLGKSGSAQTITPLCDCITDQVEQLSRFERLIMAAALEGDYRHIVGLAKGIVNAGAKSDEINKISSSMESRVKDMVGRCTPRR